MLSRVKDLKGSFISFCAKQGGMPLGRTAFQDFEISYFLNAAYSKLVSQRVQQYIEMNEKLGEGAAQRVEVERRDVYGGHILSELGSLYRSSYPTPELAGLGLIGDRKFKLWGPFSRIFEIGKVNGCTPYVIGADLHETESDDMDVEDLSYSYPVRFITAGDELRYTLLLRGADDYKSIPYRIGRMRTIIVRDQAALVDDTLHGLTEAFKALLLGVPPTQELMQHMTNFIGFQQLYIIELLHIPNMHPKNGPCKLYMTLQMICHPKPIQEIELAQEDTRELEVTFGYEIAELAAQMAMGALTSGGQQPQPEA